MEDGDDRDRTYRVTSIVEKPEPGKAPSNLAVIGRYVLTPKIFDKLEQTQRGAGGEIQLTDAIQALMEEQGVFGYAFEGQRYDAGTTMGWLQASVELALARPDIGRRVPGVPALAGHLSPAEPRPAAGVGCAGAARAAGRGDEHTVTEIGTTLGGRYRLLELLGQGGMATIYRARDAQLERDVAVKLLRPEYGQDPDFLARFRDEARAVASLSHPNIVPVFDFGEDASGPYIVMELIDGQDLASILREQRGAGAAPGRPHRGRRGPRPAGRPHARASSTAT